ncbi:MAG: Zn-dependent hydrolase, partial [Sphingomonas sp.]
MTRLLKIVGGAILLLVVIGALIVTIVPQFLDRIYYRGSTSSHFDGARFFNPDGDADTKQIQPKGSGGGRASFFWKYFTGSDGRPAWPTSVAVNRVAPPAQVEGERMVVTWVGHASVLIQTQGLNILTDPVWAEKAGPLGTGPRRLAEPGIAFDALPR